MDRAGKGVGLLGIIQSLSTAKHRLDGALAPLEVWAQIDPRKRRLTCCVRAPVRVIHRLSWIDRQRWVHGVVW